MLFELVVDRAQVEDIASNKCLASIDQKMMVRQGLQAGDILSLRSYRGREALVRLTDPLPEDTGTNIIRLERFTKQALKARLNETIEAEKISCTPVKKIVLVPSIDVTTAHDLDEHIRETLVENQTPEIYVEAIKQTGCALKFVKNPTPEMRIMAVKQNGLALQYIENQTPEMCIMAVKQNGLALMYVENQTEEICLVAVQQNGAALKFVENQTPEICIAAMKQAGYALKYVKKQTPEICLAAVKQSGLALEYVKR